MTTHDDMTFIVVKGARLEGLELILGGLLGGVDGFCLPNRKPANWALTATLNIATETAAGLRRGDTIEIRDPDLTPLAALTVDEIDDGWVSGRTAALQPAEHGVARRRRVTGQTDFAGHRVALFKGAVSPVDVIAAERSAAGGPLDLVAVGGHDHSSSLRLVRELEACAAGIEDCRVWFVPEAEVSDGSGDDIATAVVEGRGAADVMDFRHDIHPPLRGAVLLFTGLSGAGKSTVARAVTESITAAGSHYPVLLDGDDLRHELSGDLGFSPEDRDRNLRRLAWVAARVAEGGGLAVCAPIAPFASSRAAMRDKVEPTSPFLVVHVSTPLEVAEGRDRKGLYAKARAGLISDFTGIDSPYEEPTDADLRIDTSVLTVSECVDAVLELLRRQGLVDD